MSLFKNLMSFVVLALLILGCTTKNVTEVIDPTYYVQSNQATVYAVASKYFCSYCGIYHSYKMAEYTDINGIGSIPLITIGGDTMPLYQWYPTDIIFLEENVSMPTGETCPLKISGEHGASSSTLICPDSFNLVSPSVASTITIRPGIDTGIPLVWRKSSGAEWYYVYYMIDISYIDTLGGYGYAYFYSSDAVTDTTLLVSLDKLFGGSYGAVDSITYGYGNYQVMACSGPILKPGSAGNIVGADKGFYWLRNGPASVYFSINGSSKGSKMSQELSCSLCDSLWWAKVKELGYMPENLKPRYFNFCKKNK